MKRKPLLIDHLLAQDDDWKMYRKPFRERMRGLLHESKRFVLDADAARHVGKLIHDAPETVARGQEFALLPFKRMWIEFPLKPLRDEVMQGIPEPEQDMAMSVDSQIGYLFVGPHVYAASLGEKELSQKEKHAVAFHGWVQAAQALMLPMRYLLNKPFTIKEELDFCGRAGISRIMLDNFFWGASALHKNIEGDLSRAFRAHHSIEILDTETVYSREQMDQWCSHLMIAGCAGELRNIIALLLMLNQTNNNIYLKDVAPMRQMLHNKVHTYVSHHILSINLGAIPRIIEMVNGPAAVWRREHDVRGHFCHNEEARNAFCDPHDWREYDVNQWRCMHCAGLRWWRKEHRRGHKEKGVVEAKYDVTSTNVRKEIEP